MDLGYCTREAMNVPSGERYELCRSVHAEMNAIISAARRDTLGATLYLAGREAKSGELLHDATSCSMCRRLIINAGIDRVVIRNTEREYSVVHVEDWVREDDSCPSRSERGRPGAPIRRAGPFSALRAERKIPQAKNMREMPAK